MLRIIYTWQCQAAPGNHQNPRGPPDNSRNHIMNSPHLTQQNCHFKRTTYAGNSLLGSSNVHVERCMTFFVTHWRLEQSVFAQMFQPCAQPHSAARLGSEPQLVACNGLIRRPSCELLQRRLNKEPAELTALVSPWSAAAIIHGFLGLGAFDRTRCPQKMRLCPWNLEADP
jgi:hypothetical protein